MSPLRRFLNRHVDRALAWEQHVTDALAVFDFDDDASEPIEPAARVMPQWERELLIEQQEAAVTQYDRDFAAANGVKL